MKLHLFYASAVVLCLSLFLLSEKDIRPSAINIYEVTATISAILLALILIGKQYLLLGLRFFWKFLHSLPLPSWLTPKLSLFVLILFVAIAFIIGAIADNNRSNDWIELPLMGVAWVFLAGSAYLLFCLVFKAIYSKTKLSNKSQ